MVTNLDIQIVDASKSQVSNLDTGGKKHPFAVAYSGDYIQVFTFKDSALQVATAAATTDLVNKGKTDSLKWSRHTMDRDTNFPKSSKSGVDLYATKKCAAITVGTMNYLFFINDKNSVLRAVVFDPTQDGSPVGWCRILDTPDGNPVTVDSAGVSACHFGSSNGILLTYLAKGSSTRQIVHLYLDVSTLDLRAMQWVGHKNIVDAGDLLDDRANPEVSPVASASLDQQYVQTVASILPQANENDSTVRFRAYALLAAYKLDGDDKPDVGLLTSWDLGSNPTGDWPATKAQAPLLVSYDTRSGGKTVTKSRHVFGMRGARIAADPAGRLVLACNDFGATSSDDAHMGMRLLVMQPDGTLTGSNPMVIQSRSDPSAFFTITNNVKADAPDSVQMCVVFSNYDDTTNLGIKVADYGKVSFTRTLVEPNRDKDHLTLIADALPSPTPSTAPPGYPQKWDDSSPSGTVGYDLYGYSISNTDERGTAIEMEYSKAVGFVTTGAVAGRAWDVAFTNTAGTFAKSVSSTYTSSSSVVQTKGQTNPFPGGTTYLVVPASQAFVRALPSMDILTATFLWATMPVCTAGEGDGIKSAICTPQYRRGETAVPKDFFTYAQDPSDMSSYLPSSISSRMSDLYRKYDSANGAGSAAAHFGELSRYFTSGKYFDDVVADLAVPFDGSAPRAGAIPMKDYPLTISLDGAGQTYLSTGSRFQVEQGTTLEHYLKIYFGASVSFSFIVEHSASFLWGFEFTSRQSRSTSSAQSFSFNPVITQNPLSGGQELRITLYRMKPSALWAKELQVFPEIAMRDYITKNGGDPSESRYRTFSYDLYQNTTDFDAALPQRILVSASYNTSM